MNVFDQIEGLLALPNMTQTKLAVRLGVSQATIARWSARKVSPEGQHRDRIRELYSQALAEEAESVTSASPVPNASFPPQYQRLGSDSAVPLKGQTVGGPNGKFILNGQTIDYLFRPPNLLNIDDAYAVRIYGTSMEPRYKAGETIWINPIEPVRAGDDVVVQIIDGDDEHPESYIKEFVSQSVKVLRLKQLNPDEGEQEILEFPAERVFSVHKVVFHAKA